MSQRVRRIPLSCARLRSAALLNYWGLGDLQHLHCKAAILSVSFPYLFHVVSILSPFRSRSFLVPASKKSLKSAGEWSDTSLSHHTAGTAVWLSQGMFRAWVARVHVQCLEEVYLVALEANWCFFCFYLQECMMLWGLVTTLVPCLEQICKPKDLQKSREKLFHLCRRDGLLVVPAE